ncbi:MAG TPA: DNA polymerase I [Caldilineae bacterium]|nr:DNA polymerase I [Caldilineae bacterium]
MKLILIDGHSLAYRAFFALPPDMANSQGELTNATYGFTSMLLNVLRDQQPTHIAVAFDVGRSFRQEQYEDYKATRERMPDELRSQIDRIREVVEAFNIPIFTAEGYEADDVLATLAHQAAPQCVQTVIVTGDRDLLQVVEDKIWVLTSGRKFSDTIIYDPQKVQERYGLSPRQLIDLKAMVGDKSDNIPGVYGVGEKGATKLLLQWGSLDAIYEHLDEVTPTRARNALAKHRDEAYLSRALGTIVDVPGIELDLDACVVHDFDRQAVLKIFAELDFRTMASRLPAQVSDLPIGGEQLGLFGDATTDAARPTAPSGYRAITTPEALAEVADHLAASERICFDVETTSTDEHQAKLVGLALGWGEGSENNVYIPISHQAGQQLTLEQVQQAVGAHLKDADKQKLAHNAKYDLIVCRRHGLPVHGPILDTMIGEFLLDPGSRSLGLKSLAFKRLGIEMTPISDLIGKGKKQITIDQIGIERVTDYAAADVDMTWRLAEQILPELTKKGLGELFWKLEMPLLPVLADMEMVGVVLDADYLAEMSVVLQARLEALATAIFDDVGYSFNLNSTQQLSDALFGTLGLPTAGLKKTKSKHYSTAAAVLEGLRGQHPVIDRLLEYRQLTKLKSTYVDALPKLINPETGRLHTSFDQTGAETGRISSNNPNLQNIPVRSELGRRVRKAFVAPPGHYLLAVDYSQVELRILAHLSGDETMLANFARGLDIHAATASLVYGVPIEQVNSEQRSVAKMMNFATSYGVSAYGLSNRTTLSINEAREFMRTYFDTYPGVKRYLDETIARVKRDGYVETILGRRRYFPIFKTTARGAQQARAAAERAAVNHPIQGSAADILKLAMLAVHRRLREQDFAARMILQVHDEIVLQTPEAELADVARLVVETMEGAYELAAPLKAEPEYGRDWYDLQAWRA